MVIGFNSLPTIGGSWLSLRLCGRSNYRTTIPVRNLAGAHAVPMGRCFLKTWMRPCLIFWLYGIKAITLPCHGRKLGSFPNRVVLLLL